MSISGPHCRTALVILTLWFCAPFASARAASTPTPSPSADLVTKVWTVADGLPQATVNSIAQTPDGYIWVATFDGLARFDGVRFRVFRKSNTPELPINRVSSLGLDKTGRMWIWTEDPKVLVSYFDETFRAFTVGVDFGADNIAAPISFPDEVRFRSGNLEFVFDGESFVEQPAIERQTPAPRAFWSSDREVWVDMGDSFAKVTRARLEFHRKTDEPPFDARPWPLGIPFEVEGSLLFVMPGPESGPVLCQIVDRTVRSIPIASSNARSFLIDRSGNLWISHFENGLDRIDGRTLRDPTSQPVVQHFSEENGLASSNVVSLVMDRDGNIWAGLVNGLQLIVQDPEVTVYDKKSGLPTENIYAVAEDPSGDIWFGGWNGSLIRYSAGRFTWEYMQFVSALFSESDGGMYVGANPRALYRAPGSRASTYVFPNGDEPVSNVHVIGKDSQGNMWFGGLKGLARSSPAGIRTFTTRDGLPGDSITSFLQTSRGEIWVGSVTGLARFEGDRFVSFTVGDGMSGNFVRSLHEDRDGNLWIGTYDSGMTRYRDGKFAAITSAHGLFSDGVFCILEDDDGWFWMSSNQGIFRVSRDELNAVADGRSASVTSISYGPEDGLRNVEANGGKQPAGIRSRDGRLWFATAGGLAVIDPKKVRQRSVAPTVLIEDVSIDQVPVRAGSGSIRIEPGQTSLDIAYTALNYRGAERMRFRYRLEGLDGNWTEAGTRRTVNFSRLPYGEYMLRVAALSPDGVWNNEGAVLHIVVVPPFYKTGWFTALIAVLLALVIGGIYVYRMRQLQAINAAQSEFAQRLIDSQERERSRIAMELHDSLGQSLAVIRNRALIGLSSPEDHRRLLEQMSEISEASAAALEETRVIAHNLHPYQLEHLGLTMALKSLVDTVESSSGLVITDDIQQIRAQISADVAINVYRIVQECLSNIIRHSEASAASVDLHENSGRLMLRVSDNGKGFDSSVNASGLGLKGIRERANILGADVKIDAKPGNGTRITVSFDTLTNRNEQTGPHSDRG